MAFRTMPFFGPSFAGRSNSTTGTRTFTRCAAICAPITPAPSTATLRTWNRFVIVGLLEEGFVHRHQRRHAGAAGADQARRLGQQFGEVETGGRELGGVERVAARLL